MKVKGFLIIILFVFSIPFSVSAGMSSVNYKIDTDAIDFLGDQSSSENYQLGDTGGEVGAGKLTDSIYQLWAGFWQKETQSSDEGDDDEDDEDDEAEETEETEETDEPVLPVSNPVPTPEIPKVAAPVAPTSPAEESWPAEEKTEKQKKKKTGLLRKISEAPILRAIPNIKENVEKIEEFVVENEKTIAAATSSGIVVSTLPFLFQMNSLNTLWLLIRSLLGSLAGFLTGRRKRDWGIVYDSIIGKPVSMAVVTISDESGKIRDAKVTDKLGAYGFLVPPGKYYLSVERKGYEFVPNDEKQKIFYSGSYMGGVIEVESHGLIKKDIPLKPKEKVKKSKIIMYGIFKNLSDSLAPVIFYAGLLVSIFILIAYPTVLNSAIIIMYIIGFIVKDFIFGKAEWGIVLGKSNKKEAFASINVFNEENNNIIGRTVSDEKGRYYLVLDEGGYYVKTTGLSGAKWEGKINLKKRTAVKEKIKLENDNE